METGALKTISYFTVRLIMAYMPWVGGKQTTTATKGSNRYSKN